MYGDWRTPNLDCFFMDDLAIVERSTLTVGYFWASPHQRRRPDLRRRYPRAAPGTCLPLSDARHKATQSVGGTDHPVMHRRIVPPLGVDVSTSSRDIAQPGRQGLSTPRAPPSLRDGSSATETGRPARCIT